MCMECKDDMAVPADSLIPKMPNVVSMSYVVNDNVMPLQGVTPVPPTRLLQRLNSEQAMELFLAQLQSSPVGGSIAAADAPLTFAEEHNE